MKILSNQFPEMKFIPTRPPQWWEWRDPHGCWYFTDPDSETKFLLISSSLYVWVLAIIDSKVLQLWLNTYNQRYNYIEEIYRQSSWFQREAFPSPAEFIYLRRNCKNVWCSGSVCCDASLLMSNSVMARVDSELWTTTNISFLPGEENLCILEKFLIDSLTPEVLDRLVSNGIPRSTLWNLEIAYNSWYYCTRRTQSSIRHPSSYLLIISFPIVSRPQKHLRRPNNKLRPLHRTTRIWKWPTRHCRRNISPRYIR